jgi:hypothetical protein
VPKWYPTTFVRRVRILVAVSLLPLTAIPFGVVTAPSAVASTTPNLTFKVLGHNGDLLSGAVVGIRYVDEATETFKVETATTNGEGLASFVLSESATDIFYLANPAPSDTQNAIPLVQGWIFNGQSATLGETAKEIKFQKGDLRLQVMRSDLVTAADFAYLGLRAKFYKGLWGGLIRPGAFNLSLADLYAKGIEPTALRIYRINPLDDNEESSYLSDFPWDYGIARNASGQVQLYSDAQNTSLVGEVAGVPTVAFKQPNIRINLKNADGSQYRFPGYTSESANFTSQGEIRIHGVDEDGNDLTDYNQIGSWSYSSAVRSGQMFSLIQGAPAGRYQVTFDNFGSWEFPRISRDFWVDSAGRFSLSAGGPFTSETPFIVDLTIETATVFKFKLLDSEGNLASGNTYFSSKTKEATYRYYTGSGRGLVQLPRDQYDLAVSQDDANGSSYSLDSTGNSLILRTSAGSGVTREISDSSYALTPGIPNLQVVAVNASDTHQVVQVYFEITREKEYVGGNVSGKFFIPDGNDYVLRLWPEKFGNQGFENTFATFDVINGVAQFDSFTATGGVFRIPLRGPNFNFKMINPIDESVVNGYLTACSISTDPKKGGDCRGANTENGIGKMFLNDGNYEIYAYPSNQAPLSMRQFEVSVSSGVVTSTEFTTTAGQMQIRLPTPNITGFLHSALTDTRVVFSEESSLYAAQVQLQRKVEGQDRWVWTDYSSWRTSAQFGFTVDKPGEYRIAVSPEVSDELVFTTSQSFFVNTDSKISLTPSDYQNSLSNFIVRIDTPNVKVRVIRDDDLQTLGFGADLYEVTAIGTYYSRRIYSSNLVPGLGGMRLGDGNYRLDVNPNSGVNAIGLSRQSFNISVLSGAISMTRANQAITPDTAGVFQLRMKKGNLQGRVVDIGGLPTICGNNRGVSVQLQQYESTNDYWRWKSWLYPNCSSAQFSAQIDDVGTYRIRVEPNGYAGAATGFSNTFTVSETAITAGTTFDLGDVSLGIPSIKVAVTQDSPSSRLSGIPIAIYRDGSWIDWVYTQQDGIANITLPSAGNYAFELHPNQAAQESGATRKSYSVIATLNASGKVVASVPPGVGVTYIAPETLTVLRLGIPNLKGVVHAPDTTVTLIRDAYVIPTSASTGAELWQFATSTDSLGRWSMSLPEGTYSIRARAPNGSQLYGSSKSLATITVDSVGTVSLSGAAAESRTALNFSIPLSNPRWKGQVFEPTVGGVLSTVPVPYPYICLYANDRWTCSQGDEQGRWTLTPDYDFTSFAAVSPSTGKQYGVLLEVNDWNGRKFPVLRFEGETAVSTALGGLESQSVRLAMRSTNMEIVVKAGGVVVPDAWVNIDRYRWGGSWIGGSPTNSSGIAKFVVDSLVESFTVTVDINGNQQFATDYVRTVKNFSGTSSETLTVEVSLDSPNLRGVLREPNATPSQGTAVPWSWLNVYNETKNLWMQGANTNQNGRFALNLERPSDGSATFEYTISAYPAWNTTSDVTPSRYTAVVTSAGSVTLYPKGKPSVSVPTEVLNGSTHYTFSLGTPSVTGFVVMPDSSPAAWSYVLPIESDQKQWLWQNGTSANSTGKFMMDLPDNTYQIQAKRPWGSDEVADSAFCEVVVSGGAVTNNGPSCEDGTSSNQIRLALRQPNVKFKLVDSTGQSIVGAQVSVGFGNWSTWSNSNESGTVSLFIDTDAMTLLNPWYSDTTINFYVWVYPPGGATFNMVQWGCSVDDNSKPICNELVSATRGVAYPTTNIDSITVLGPNTSITVKKPGGTLTAPQDTFVYVYELETGCSKCRNWAGWSRVNSSGEAPILLDTTSTKRFAVEVWPNWYERNTLAQKYHDNGGLGYTREQLDSLTFELGTPNLNLRILAPDGLSPSKWAWLRIEVIDSATGLTQYGYKGLQMDEQGRGGTLLESLDGSLAYRLSIYPGNGQAGSTTQCVLYVDVSGVVTTDPQRCWNETITAGTLELNLSSGNVTGQVNTPANQPLAGAVVYANYQETLTTSVVATTNASGYFSLELGADKTWTITVIPLTVDGSQSPYKSEAITVTTAQLAIAQTDRVQHLVGVITLSNR